MNDKVNDIKDFAEHGYHFSNCLYHALTKGVEDYAADTERRRIFVADNQHFFAGVMLIGMFSYLESILGRNWIDRCGGKQSRELHCLRFVRNAFVHANSHIRDLDSYSEDLENKLRAFIEDLATENITDDKGNIYPCYMSISDGGVVNLNSDAINIFRAITRTLAH